MPNYDYFCKKCNRKFEVFQSIKAPPLKKCPTCGSPVKRLIGGGGGIIFKGSGFYATDYRKSGEKEKQGDGGAADACKSCKDDTCPAKKEKKKD